MTFPTAHSSIIHNEDGEVLGWDTHYADDDPREDYDYEDNEPPEPKDRAQCIEWDMHGTSGEGTDEDDIYSCDFCLGLYRLHDDGTITDINGPRAVTDETLAEPVASVYGPPC